MKFVVDWQTFRTKSKTGNIYYDEYDTYWIFYKVVQGSEIMVCKVNKSYHTERNIMFIDKNITNNPDMIRIKHIIEDNYMVTKQDDMINFDDMLNDSEILIEEVEEVVSLDDAL